MHKLSRKVKAHRDGRVDPSPHPKTNWRIRVAEAVADYTFESEQQRELVGSLILWRHRLDPNRTKVILRNGTLLRAVSAVDARDYPDPWVITNW